MKTLILIITSLLLLTGCAGIINRSIERDMKLATEEYRKNRPEYEKLKVGMDESEVYAIMRFQVRNLLVTSEGLKVKTDFDDSILLYFDQEGKLVRWTRHY